MGRTNRTIGDKSVCYICGRNGAADPLDRHHIYGGANRKLSEEDGLCVMLCHNDCHLFGESAVHQNHDVNLWMKQVGQRYAMLVYGWTEDEFRQRYGKSYLSEKYDTVKGG